MKNQVQLIAYVDRFCGGDLAQLNRFLKGPLAGVFSGVHLLPFFTPIDGADAGFDPMDHAQVDTRLGTWKDVQDLSSTDRHRRRYYCEPRRWTVLSGWSRGCLLGRNPVRD